jgi:hypothetical protein
MDIVDPELGWARPRRALTARPTDFVVARPPQSALSSPSVRRETAPKRAAKEAEEVRELCGGHFYFLCPLQPQLQRNIVFTCLQRFMSVI